MFPKTLGHQRWATRCISWSAWGRWSGQRLMCGCCEYRRWYHCSALSQNDFDPLFSVSASEQHDVTGSRQASTVLLQRGLEVSCTLKNSWTRQRIGTKISICERIWENDPLRTVYQFWVSQTVLKQSSWTLYCLLLWQDKGLERKHLFVSRFEKTTHFAQFIYFELVTSC